MLTLLCSTAASLDFKGFRFSRIPLISPGHPGFAGRVLPGSVFASVASRPALPPSRPHGGKARGDPPSVQGSSHATFAASSPIFRASLVQTGCPSAPVVLDGFPPLLLGFRLPSAEKRWPRFAEVRHIHSKAGITRVAGAACQRPGLLPHPHFASLSRTSQAFHNPPEQSGAAPPGGPDSMPGIQAQRPAILGSGADSFGLLLLAACLIFLEQASSLCSA